MYRFKFDKLVRDKTPEFLEEMGVTVDFRKMSEEQIFDVLKEKLLEEVNELLKAKNSTEVVQELADILEVIKSISHVNKIDFSEIEKIAAEKKLQRGGFDEAMVVNFVEVEGGNPLIEYYRENPDKYPEII